MSRDLGIWLHDKGHMGGEGAILTLHNSWMAPLFFLRESIQPFSFKKSEHLSDF